jgi:alpha-beta hydrolase superfamily lysophospholipase
MQSQLGGRNSLAELRTFRSSDRYLWYYRYFPATGTPHGRLVFVHGIRSHGGWYERSCEQFSRAGFEVYFLDRRGSGLNTTHRGDSPTFRRLLDDVAEFLLELRRSQPAVPIHFAGISWGGKLAIGLPYRKPGLIDSLLLFCPGIFAKVSPSLGQRVQIARVRFRDPTRMFPIPLSEPELFTSSLVWQKFIREDRHGLRTVTARFLFSSVSLDLYLQRAAKRVTVPTLLLLAGNDRVIDNLKVQAFVDRFPAAKRTIEYADSQHTLEFENPDHPFVPDCIRWLTENTRESVHDRHVSDRSSDRS